MSPSRTAHLVVDLGFGNASKGTLTDWLVRRHGAGLVVRFNGGAQAGHNGITDDGRHHTFSQFGAGIGGGAPHPEWQNAEFAWDDLGAALRRFKHDLRQLLELKGPPTLPSEWKKRFSELV
ncbi:adenylosuccinate synthetase [Myxococcus sp. MxC21-1]|uniref:adenylosuccinate synthetase n=1 Tax=Myxococcus sp. MxC21-1 TaxID=3041439 RepID=UPI00292F87DE|nr:adenylosuccinate synthetase [Myxococcus sp. MxC21-1]WNZ64202.1 adenylosuccinate synthetase [Myxococcus sp. MxC21-1]